MFVNLTTRDKGDVTIIDVNGKLAFGVGSSALHEKIRDLVETGSHHILINMAGIDSIDSYGLGELVTGYTTVNTAGGEMKLLHVGRRVKHLLHMTRLCAVFETHDDETSAIRSFLPARIVAPFESRSELYFG